ncbi:MAG TPA: STAS domain-containing protein [Ilumatobacteraceae bacterium]|nr:STAS domain-containing protein [Ilumatobacteraceae bacterium]
MTSSRGPVAFPVRDSDRTVVWLRGEHDVSTVAALSQTMARAIALDDGDLVIDLSGVDFMDAATVGVIVRARDFLELQSRTLALRSPSTSAARVLDLCDLADLREPRPVDEPRAIAKADALPARRAERSLELVDTADDMDEAGDLQERARRGDIALLSLLRLDERTNAHRRSLAEVAIARLRISRTSRSTRFTRPG